MMERYENFLKIKISAREYLFIKNDIPYLIFVLRYFPHRAETDSNKMTRDRGKNDNLWKTKLSEHDMGLFNLLRDWRSQRSKKEGLPPYIIFTNLQLTHIVKKRPQSLAELTQIEGIGKVKA